MNITNLIPIIRNALKANKTKTSVVASKQILPFLEVLVASNYIKGYSPIINGKINIFLHYTLKKSPLKNIKNISKPSSIIYINKKDLWKFDKSLGLVILSNSKGIITNKTALKLGLGGKVLCYII